MSRTTTQLYGVTLAVVVIDQLSKWLADTQGVAIVNQGVSFGLFSLLPPSALTISLILMLCFVWYSYRSAWQRQPLASSLFFGGGISNVIDRVMIGGVRDWLPVPFFNLQNNFADYAIAFGLLWLLLFGLRKSYNQTLASEPKGYKIDDV